MTDVQGLVNAWTAKVAPATVRRRYAVLRAILTAAVESELLGRSPCKRSVKLPALEYGERRIITPDELARLAEHLGDDYGALVYVGATLGLRIGELAGLRVGRLDLLRGTLSVAESVGEVDGILVHGAPKSKASQRTMTMPAPLVALLAEHLQRRGLTAAQPEAFVFPAPDGGPLRYGNFMRRVWHPARRAALLPHFTPHDLKRAAATAMVALGVDVRTAQARLGHSDPRLTLAIYAQATSAGDRAAADQLGAHFMPPETPTSADNAQMDKRAKDKRANAQTNVP